MNICEALLEMPIQTKAASVKIADFASTTPQRFKELMHCFLANDYRLAQRAAWCVSLTARKNKTCILPYISTLVAQLDKTNVHPAVIRNSLRILQEITIPENLLVKAVNACFALIESPTQPVAIKAFSLSILANASAQIPELKNEIRLVIDYHIDNESAAFKSRAQRVLKQMEH